ncbi:hypothetical protein [Enterobacter ludwigii]|uniref:hypothetical protein n=1 Tax=Enterobacter ludwigii TaxID=299767 RepID=UPI00307680D0
MEKKSDVSATILSTVSIDNMQSVIAGVLGYCDSECNCLLTAGVDTQRDRYHGVVYGCNKRAVVPFEFGISQQSSDEMVSMSEEVRQILSFIERMEQAARRGLELNHDRESSIPADKTISVEQCEWTLKDCHLFRSVIADIFGLPQQIVAEASRIAKQEKVCDND